MVDVNEQGLIDRVFLGDTDAFGDLVRIHQEFVYWVCYRLLGVRQEAEDLAQDTFIRAYERIHTFDRARPFSPWIRRIASNLCYNYLQSNKQNELPIEYEASKQVGRVERLPETIHERHEQFRAIQHALMYLPARYRVVIELRHFQELSYNEISETLGIPLSDVKSHLYRGRKMLADELLSEPGEPDRLDESPLHRG